MEESLWNSLLTVAFFLLQQKFIASPVKQANIFLTLLRDISPTNTTRNEIEGCISCLLSSGADDCFKVWRMNYKKQQLPSLLLLRAIGKFYSFPFPTQFKFNGLIIPQMKIGKSQLKSWRSRLLIILSWRIYSSLMKCWRAKNARTCMWKSCRVC